MGKCYVYRVATHKTTLNHSVSKERPVCANMVTSTYGKGRVCEFQSWHTLISVSLTGRCVLWRHKLCELFPKYQLDQHVYRQQMGSIQGAGTKVPKHTYIHTVPCKPSGSGSRYPLEQQAMYALTAQQGSISRAPLKIYYGTSPFVFAPLWNKVNSLQWKLWIRIFCRLNFSFQGQSLEETHKKQS